MIDLHTETHRLNAVRDNSPDFKLLAAAEYNPKNITDGIGTIAESCASVIRRRNTPTYKAYAEQTKLDSTGQFRPQFSQTDGIRHATESILECLGQGRIVDQVNRDGFLKQIPSSTEYSDIVTEFSQTDTLDAINYMTKTLVRLKSEIDNSSKKPDELTGQEGLDHWELVGRISAYQNALEVLGFPNVVKRVRELDTKKSPKEESSSESENQEISTVQPWINMEAWRATQDSIGHIRAHLEEGLSPGEYLKNVLKTYEKNGKTLHDSIEAIFSGETEGITFMLYHSDYLTQLAGIKIESPIFLVSQSFHDKYIYAESKGQIAKALGSCNEGIYFRHPLWSQTNLIMAVNDPRTLDVTLDHETRHTIDPFMQGGDRKGYDGLLAEMFAFFEYSIINKNQNWDIFKRSIGHEAYFNTYSSEVDVPITMDEWDDLVNKCSDKMRQMYDTNGEIESQRQLVQVATIDELLALPI